MRKKRLVVLDVKSKWGKAYGGFLGICIASLASVSGAWASSTIVAAFNSFPRIDPNYPVPAVLLRPRVEVFDGLSTIPNEYLATSSQGYYFSVASTTDVHEPGDPMYLRFTDPLLDKSMSTYTVWGAFTEYGYRIGGEAADSWTSSGPTGNPVFTISAYFYYLDELAYPSLYLRKIDPPRLLTFKIDHLAGSTYFPRQDIVERPGNGGIYSLSYAASCGSTTPSTCIELEPPEGNLSLQVAQEGYSATKSVVLESGKFRYGIYAVYVQPTTAPLFRSAPPIDPPWEYKHRARLEALLGQSMVFGYLQTAVGEQPIDAAGIDNLESAGFTGTDPVRFILNDVRLLPGGEAVVTVRAMSPVSIHAMNLTIAFDNLEVLGIDDVVPETESVLDGATFADYQFQRTNGSLEYRALISFDESPADLSDEEATPLLTFRFPVPADTPVGTNVDVTVRAGIEDITQLSSAVDEAYRLVAREAGPVAIGYHATIKVRDDLDVPAVSEVVAHVLATGQPVKDVNQDGVVDSGDIQSARVR